MTSTTRSILGAIGILSCTLSLAFILSHYTSPMGWVDFTENQRYTLTDGTKSILGKIRRPLEAKLFFSQTTIDRVASDQLKQFIAAHVYVRDLLAAFERESGGKLTFAEYDPRTFSDAAEEAAALGVQIQPVLGTYTFAFGLAVTSDTGAKEVIPFINAREQGLFEYKVTKLIERASRPAKKKIGIVSGLAVLGDNLSPEMARLYRAQRRPVKEKWNFAQWLERDYDVESVPVTAMRIPDGLDFLLAIHPKGFSDQILYAIDQYVMRGGKLIAFADPFCNSDQPPPNPSNPYAQFSHERASDFNRLTNAWGVEMKTGTIIGDRDLAIMQNQVQHLPYVMFAGAKNCFKKDEVITQALEDTARVLMIHAGALSKVAGATTDVFPLIQTTAKGGTRKFGTLEFMKFRQEPSAMWDPGNPMAADDAGKEGFELAKAPLAAAVRISGKLKSAFPDGLPGDPPEGEDPDKETREKVKKEHLAESKEPNNVVLFGDADLLSNDFIVAPSSWFSSPMSNKAILYNTLDYLSGSGDLISIRSRSSARREFTYIMDIRREAAKATADTQREIQDEINKFQTVITNLQNAATKKGLGIAKGEALKKEREANLSIIRKKRELNDVKRDSTLEEEAVMFWAKFSNTLGLPALVALIGLILWIMRMLKRTRQMQEDMA
jgi:gliding motility-associatede transport system auxiliary component